MVSNINYTISSTSVSPQVWGFGGSPSNSVSLSVTFFDTNGNPLAPTSAEVWLSPANRPALFGPSKICDWTLGSGQSNGDFIDYVGGPVNYIQLNWSVTWGSAASAVIAISANKTGNGS